MAYRSFSSAPAFIIQAAGRLIRTVRDRGVLCILDPRLRTRRYGAAFARSLPAFQPAADLDEVASFFRF